MYSYQQPQQQYQTMQATIPITNVQQETGLSLLSKTSGITRIDERQANVLLVLRYKESGNPIIDPSRRDILQEIIGMLTIQPFEEVVAFLEEATNPKYILWNQPSVEEGRIKVAREIIIRQAEDSGIKGVGKCKFCASTELIFVLMQLRSGDEPATVFVKCTLCGQRWKG